MKLREWAVVKYNWSRLHAYDCLYSD